MLLLTTSVQGLSMGAPDAACGDITPNHAANSPSNDPFPYTVDLSSFTGNEYIPGETYLSKKYKSCTQLAIVLFSL